MSTILAPNKEVIRLRKRPAKDTKQVREVFGNEVHKELPIPGLIDLYNYEMNSVDIADQLRGQYAWVPLWRYLFQTALTNAAQVWLDNNSAKTKRSGHYQFRMSCASTLMAYGDEQRGLPQQMKKAFEKALHSSPTLSVHSHSENTCNGEHIVLSQNARSCAICLRNGKKAERGTPRKPLAEMSVNYIRGKGGIKAPKKPDASHSL